MIKTKDVEALRKELKEGDIVEVEVSFFDENLNIAWKRELRVIKRKYPHLVELTGPGHDTVSYIQILLDRTAAMNGEGVVHRDARGRCYNRRKGK